SWPADGDGLDVGVAYDRLEQAGYEYGPAFRGLRRVSGAGEESFAEIELDDAQAANGYHVHPALVDAALQAGVLAHLEALASGRPEVPFSFAGVRLLGGGGSSVRAQVRTGGDGWSVVMVDEWGAPVLSIASVRTRAIDPSQLV